MKQYAGRLADPEVRRCYWVWASMIQRCKNPKDKQYPNYGGRGISVHPPWLKFDQFFADMGPRPTPDHTLERDDNSLGYGPDNCRWATPSEQSKNQRARIRSEDLPTGVTKRPNGRYQARVRVDYRHVYLGVFDTPELAGTVAKEFRAAHGFAAGHGSPRT